LFIHGSFRISRRPGDVFTESMSQYEARSIIARCSRCSSRQSALEATRSRKQQATNVSQHSLACLSVSSRPHTVQNASPRYRRPGLGCCSMVESQFVSDDITIEADVDDTRTKRHDYGTQWQHNTARYRSRCVRYWTQWSLTLYFDVICYKLQW